MRILIADSLYPDFLRTVPFDPGGTYAGELQKVMDCQFGTSTFYSMNLAKFGWQTMDVLTNHDPLQELWNRENGTRGYALGHQIDQFQPDVLFLQDLSITWESRHRPTLIAAQCSCRLPDIELVTRCNLIFSSFQFYVPKFAEVGVKCVYLPLAFEPSVLVGEQPERYIDISFAGGLGRDLYWKQGTDTMEAIAEAFPNQFFWFGYGVDGLPESSRLRRAYRGPRWGREMYDVYRHSKIVVNRHGEITQGMMNNLRCYEATGCGALLLTEDAPNLRDFFEPNEAIAYTSPEDAVQRIRGFLSEQYASVGRGIAANGQARTLRDHTYEKRMGVVSDTLMSLL